MIDQIEEILKSAYLASGGTESGFLADRNDLLNQYRKQFAIGAALEAAQRKPTMNDVLAQQRDAERANSDDVLSRFVNQEGANR